MGLVLNVALKVSTIARRWKEYLPSPHEPPKPKNDASEVPPRRLALRLKEYEGVRIWVSTIDPRPCRHDLCLWMYVGLNYGNIASKAEISHWDRLLIHRKFY